MSKADQDKISRKGIYFVKEDIYIVDPNYTGKKGVLPRVVIIPEGEFLEFRYFIPAHFRDVNNNYFPIADKQLEKLLHVADIWEKVCFNNNASLLEILTLKLYDEKDPENFPVGAIFMERGRKLKKHFDKLNVEI